MKRKGSNSTHTKPNEQQLQQQTVEQQRWQGNHQINQEYGIEVKIQMKDQHQNDKSSVSFPYVDSRTTKNSITPTETVELSRRGLYTQYSPKNTSNTDSNSSTNVFPARLPQIRSSLELPPLPKQLKTRMMSSDEFRNVTNNNNASANPDSASITSKPKKNTQSLPKSEEKKFRQLLLLRQTQQQLISVVYSTSAMASPKKRTQIGFSQKIQQQENTQYLSSTRRKQQQQQQQPSREQQQQQDQLQRQNDMDHCISLKRFNESSDRRLKFSCKTKVGFSCLKKGKVNQDTPIIYPRQLAELSIAHFAVCDGHGLNGQLVSGLIRKNFPKHLTAILKEAKEPKRGQNNNNNSNASNQGKQRQRSPEERVGGSAVSPVSTESSTELICCGLGLGEIKKCIQQGIFAVNHDINKSEFDSNLSGSTFVGVFIIGTMILCANVGDSRAILARGTSPSNLQAIPLSVDHKPSLERERLRIVKSGGRVDAQRDSHGNQLGPLRVWMNTIDIPGLAMTRSMGDKVGAQAGVICEAEFIEREMTNDDRFMIIASDGVWDRLSDEDAVRIVGQYYEKGQVEQAAEKLVSECSNAWARESASRDDITCVIVFFQKNNSQAVTSAYYGSSQINGSGTNNLISGEEGAAQDR